jgi:hypothetical protein
MMRTRQPGLLGLAVFTVLGWALPAAAQEPTPQGIEVGNYNIQQSLEFGGRIADRVGNLQVYDTFVNLQSGPRLYEHTFSMRSLNHQGALFDNLSVTSFGYGGDPNDATHLRMYKNKWYDFSGSFRRDVNFWNYNLLANPLNPPTSNPALVVVNSLHLFDTVRRMSDFHLTLLPQSRVRIRLGYLRNVSEGPSYSTVHQGTDTQLFQGWKTTVNGYQVGVDFHVLPRTNLSYDQFLNYFKGDTSWVDQNFGFMLANGVPVDLGVVFNTSANQPCAVPLSASATTPPTANAGCNAYLSYSRSGRPRISTPTEQFSFESNYFANLNVAGRLVYSAADNGFPDYSEIFNGDISRTLQRGLISSGAIGARRLSVTADWAATYTVTPKFRIVDEFRFNNFRIPGSFSFNQASQFAQAPLLRGGAPSMLLPAGQFTPSSCPPPFTAPTCPQHNSGSGPDVLAATDIQFLGQDAKYNTFQLEYDFTPRFGARLGYRYGHRDISQFAAVIDQAEVFYPGPSAAIARRGDCAGAALPAGCVLQPDGSVVFSGLAAGSDTERSAFPINEHSALIGFWARPNAALRMSFDLELFSADHSFTRISPRNLQHYKFRANYKPLGWVSIAGSLNIRENRNNVMQVGNIQHNRNYGFSVALEPNGRLNLDLGYEYSDLFSMSDICFAIGSGVPAGATPCPVVSGTSPVLGISEYSNKTNFGYFNLLFRPLRRVTVNLGYTIDSGRGNAPILDPTTGLQLTLNPNAPSGPLDYNYHKPLAGLAVQLVKNLIWRAAWGYHDYDEKAAPDPTGPRSFHANLVDLTLRYSF